MAGFKIKGDIAFRYGITLWSFQLSEKFKLAPIWIELVWWMYVSKMSYVSDCSGWFILILRHQLLTQLWFSSRQINWVLHFRFLEWGWIEFKLVWSNLPKRYRNRHRLWITRVPELEQLELMIIDMHFQVLIVQI